MEQLVLTVPSMWADHHVVAVRDLLRDEEGVAIAAASALDARVSLTYDPSRTDPQRIAARLEAGGYPARDPAETSAPPPNKPAWATMASRVTTTDPADLSMSGDHRKY
jgi:hypothetical protein